MRKRSGAMSGDNADKVTLGDIHDKTLEDIVGWDYFILDDSLLPDNTDSILLPIDSQDNVSTLINKLNYNFDKQNQHTYYDNNLGFV